MAENTVKEDTLIHTTPRSSGTLSKQLITKFTAAGVDNIQLPEYRVASKLRLIQKATGIDRLGLPVVLEAVRTVGLQRQWSGRIGPDTLAVLLETMYCSMSQTLPASERPSGRHKSLLAQWLFSSLADKQATLSVFELKVVLYVMSSGTFSDQLHTIYSHLASDINSLSASMFNTFLRALLLLPSTVDEPDKFTASSGSHDMSYLEFVHECNQIECLKWLRALHSIIQVEAVEHAVACSVCTQNPIRGLRYRCTRCSNVQLCQNCFWSAQHEPQHPVKEYKEWRTAKKQLGHSMRKSLSCVGHRASAKRNNTIISPEQPIPLSNIVPATPILRHSIMTESTSSHMMSSQVSRSNTCLNGDNQNNMDSWLRADDEHKLILRYANTLVDHVPSDPVQSTRSSDAEKKSIIHELELHNQNIIEEINALRASLAESNQCVVNANDPPLLDELASLRMHRDELELRMTSLQKSRSQLVVQLDGLMNSLRSSGEHGPSSTLPPVESTQTPRPASPIKPSERQSILNDSPLKSRGLRSDLMLAADGLTSAMSSLVKELEADQVVCNESFDTSSAEITSSPS